MSDLLARGTPRPMLLTDDWGLNGEAREAVDIRLRRGCMCGAGWADLTKRVNAAGARTVTLQCVECGTSVGGPLKREHHPQWSKYPDWDEGKRQSYWARWHAEDQQRLEARRIAYAAQLATKRAGAQDFYQSDTWRWMREKVMQRAARTCEACLSRPAQTVHHTTYKFGLKAPLYTLRALCHRCHERMHAYGDEWHDTELPAHRIAGEEASE